MSAENDAEHAAGRFREHHGLGVGPLTDLIALIESTVGVDVAVLPVGPDEHGLTMTDPDRGLTVIAVAGTPNAMRYRSNLAHELGHVVFEDYARRRSGTAFAHRTEDEIRADAFARHLLAPREGLLATLEGRDPGEAELSMLVQRFEVSPAIIAIQLRAAGAIAAPLKEKWMALSAPQLATRHGWSDQYRVLQAVSSARRAPQRLLVRATEGYRKGVVSVETIARLRGAEPVDVEQELAAAGIVPEHEDVTWDSLDDLDF